MRMCVIIILSLLPAVQMWEFLCTILTDSGWSIITAWLHGGTTDAAVKLLLCYTEQTAFTYSQHRATAQAWTISRSNEKYMHVENKHDLSVVLLEELSVCSTEQMVVFSSHHSVGSI